MRSGHDRSSESLALPSGVAARPAGADALSDVLQTVRLGGALFFYADMSSPWVVDIPPAATLAPILLPRAEAIVSYHVARSGTCWASLADGTARTRLEAGDVLLVPHGDAYVMSSDIGLRARDPVAESLAFFREMASREGAPVVVEGGGGPEHFQVVCGFLACDVRPFNPVLAALPRLVHVRRAPGPVADRLDALVEFVLAEAREPRSGGRSVVLRLGELMFVEVVRRHLAVLPAGDTGWLAGLRDPEVGRAIALLHARPSFAWNLEGLAREAGLSRSVLAERFAHFVGVPPMQYLARWRMQLAARRLTDGAAKVAAVALDVGYESEAAFSRAFKKIVGMPPAAWRRRAVP